MAVNPTVFKHLGISSYIYNSILIAVCLTHLPLPPTKKPRAGTDGRTAIYGERRNLTILTVLTTGVRYGVTRLARPPPLLVTIHPSARTNTQ